MRIAVDAKIPHIGEALAGLGEVMAYDPSAVADGVLATADALITRSVTRVDATLLRAAPNLRFVGSATAGLDHVDLDALAARGIAFSNAPGANARAVAEYVVAAIARAGVTAGARVVVVGFGQVGRRVTALLRVLGHSVRVVDPPLADRVRAGEVDGEGVLGRMARDEPLLDLQDAVRGADVLTVHVPLERGGAHPTERMIDSSVLNALASGALVVNTARGGVVDEAVLRRTTDVRAVLDVWEGEPTVSGSLIESLGSRLVLATPHIAGYTVEAKVRCTVAMHRALAGHLGRETQWSPAVDPAAEVELGPSDTLATAIEAVRQLAPRDAELRAVVRAGGHDLPRAFEGLRRTAGRHELSAHRFAGGSPALRETLERLVNALPPEL